MKKMAAIISGLMCLTASLSAKTPIAPDFLTRMYEQPCIRVLLAKDILGALVEAKGPYVVVREETGDILSSGRSGKRFVAQPISEGLRWGEEYPGIYQIKILPLSKSTVLYVDGKQYAGSLSVYTRDGRIAVVNDAPLEEFVKSSLAMSAPETFEKEAMAAVAIGIRTVAYGRVLQNSAAQKLWDVVASEMNYEGRGVTRQKCGIDTAVDETRHIVLLQEQRPLLDVPLTIEKAQELAVLGCDARKILYTALPSATLSVTTLPKQEISSQDLPLRHKKRSLQKKS